MKRVLKELYASRHAQLQEAIMMDINQMHQMIDSNFKQKGKNSIKRKV